MSFILRVWCYDLYLVFDAALQVRPLIDRTNMEMNINTTAYHSLHLQLVKSSMEQAFVTSSPSNEGIKLKSQIAKPKIICKMIRKCSMLKTWEGKLKSQKMFLLTRVAAPEMQNNCILAKI